MGKKHNQRTTDKKGGKKTCDWRGCSKDHTIVELFNDRKNGVVNRTTSYPGNWSMPWRITTPDYVKFGVKEGKNVNLSSSKSWFDTTKHATSTWDAYAYQKHHVVPVACLNDFEDLKENLRLLGWNLNWGDYNGIVLPYFIEDLIWHYLQPHRGSHPGVEGGGEYCDEIKNELRKLNGICLKYCEKRTNYSELFSLTNAVISRIRHRILQWDINVHLKDTAEKHKDRIKAPMKRVKTSKSPSVGNKYRDKNGKSTDPSDILDTQEFDLASREYFIALDK